MRDLRERPMLVEGLDIPTVWWYALLLRRPLRALLVAACRARYATDVEIAAAIFRDPPGPGWDVKPKVRS